MVSPIIHTHSPLTERIKRLTLLRNAILFSKTLAQIAKERRKTRGKESLSLAILRDIKSNKLWRNHGLQRSAWRWARVRRLKSKIPHPHRPSPPLLLFWLSLQAVPRSRIELGLSLRFQVLDQASTRIPTVPSLSTAQRSRQILRCGSYP